MALVVVTASDVADRCRGFLGSVMLEIAPNVFVAPRMTKGVRERMWGVIGDWHSTEPKGSFVMVWRDVNEAGGIGISHLGMPPRELIEMDGMLLTRRRKSTIVL